MSDFDLGTARGKIDLDASGAIKGSKEADSAFKSIDGGAQSASKSSAAVGTALVGFGAAAVLAFGVAVKASADFEKKISEFKSLGADYANNIDAIREKALQLGADTAFSAGEAADALVELGKQGLSTTEILDGAADATTSLAAAGGIDLAEAAGIAAAALNQFKLEAKDLPEVANLLTGAANASATGVHEIGEAFKFVGPVAQAVGLSIKDTAGAIALLANNGLDAGQAGTALRAILTRLQPASKEAAGTMRELGLITKDGKNQFFDAAGNIKSFADITDILGKSTSKLTAQQKAQALQTIFGTEALSAANIVAGEGKDAFLELQKAIGDVKAADVAKEKMNNLAGALDEFQGSVETALIRAGAPFQKGLTGIVQAATQVINIFSSLSPEIQKWIGYAVAAAGVAALLVGGIILLKDALVKAKVAFAAFNAVMDANPIALVILAIAAIAAALVIAYNNVQPFHDAVDRLWQAMQPLVDTIRNGIGKALEWLSGTVLPFVLQKFDEAKNKASEIAQWLGDKLKGPIDTAWSFIQDKVGGVVGWLQNTAGPGIQSVWQKLPEGLGSVVESVEGFLVPRLTSAFEGIKTALGNVAGFLETTFGPAAKRVWGEVQLGASTLKDYFTNTLAPGIAGFFTNTVQPKWNEFTAWLTGTFVPNVQTALQALASTAGDNVKNALTSAGEAVASGDFQNKIVEIFNNIKNAIGTAFSFITDTVGPKISQFIAFVIEQFGFFKEWANVNLGPLFAAIGELITAVFNTIGPAIQTALDIAKTIISVFVVAAILVWNLFGETFLNIIMAVWGTIRGVIEGALKIITGIIQVATALLTGDWGKAWEGILNIVKGAGQLLFAIVNGVVELVVGIVQGMGNGIMRIIGFAFDWIKEKAAEAWNALYQQVADKVNAVRSVVQGVADFLGSVFNIDLGGAARKIMDSFINVIKDKIQSIKDLFQSVTNLIPSWKGPPQKDAKLLTKNGELIMQSLINGVSSKIGDVKSMLGTVAPMMSSTIDPGSLAPSPAANGNIVNIKFEYSGGNPDEFVSTVEGSGIIGRLTSAARSRRT